MEELQLNKKNIISFYRFLSHESYSHFQVFMVNENGKSSQITSQSSFPSQSYFINDEKILLKGCEKFKDKGIICLGINEREKGHTKIEDGIHKINLILFDIDVIEVVREDGIAPQKYIEKASMIGEEIEKRLNELGFTVDYKAFSGNGLHGGIKVNIELPKFKSKKKWKESEFYQRLVALENEMRAFETNEIKIDTISKDIARRVKIPGTFNIKRYKIGEKQYKLMAPEKWRITRIVYLNENVNEQKNNEAFFNLLLPELLEKKKERDPLDFLDEKETPIELEYFIKKDRKLKRLMEGDSSDYNSRSEAEMGLVIKLVHYGFNTRSSIDPIMNSCNLGKWQEKGEDYKDLTLENATSYHDAHYPAVERLYETYEKVFKRPATRISKGKEYETKDFQSWKTENYEDFDDRELYIQISEKCKHQFNIITLKQSKIMMIGNGYYYTSDITEVIEFVALQLRDENVKNFKTMKANVFELIQDTSSFDEKDFYFEDRFIPFLNGYYDLEKETLHPYEGDIDKPFFYVIPHEYKRGLYDCPKFKKKIKEWVINPNSKINEEDIFESFGYTMTPSTAYKALFINFGPPHTAKSQLLNILNSLVGMENSITTSLSQLSERFEMRFLQWKILAKAADMSNSTLYDNANLKNMTGGDLGGRGEVKGGDVFDYRGSVKFWCNINELPKIYNISDTAFYDRVILFLYERVYKMDDEDNRRDFYLEITTDEDEMQGIIHESLKGMKRLRKRKEFRKEIREDTKHRWLSISNEPYRFISDTCMIHVDLKVKRDDLWDKYCEEYGSSYGRNKFYKTVEMLGFKAKQAKDPSVKKPFYYFHGLDFKDSAILSPEQLELIYGDPPEENGTDFEKFMKRK